LFAYSVDEIIIMKHEDNVNGKDREKLTSNSSTHDSSSKCNDRKSLHGANEDGEVREEPLSKLSQLLVKKNEYKQPSTSNLYYGDQEIVMYVFFKSIIIIDIKA